MNDQGFVVLDWGTTRLRAFRLAENGAELDRREAEAGIRNLADGAFEEAFEAIAGDWLPDDPGAAPPILLGGMIGSRQGWLEVPYAPCPADPEQLGALTRSLVTRRGHRLHFAPGLSTRIGGRADVMRGEELQILGAMQELGPGERLVCLPGTHSKWAEIGGGRIRDFRTFMTGELFDVLRRHSILGRTMDHAAWSESGFARGLDRAAEGGPLLADLFSVRALALFGELAPEEGGSYLSGLLIGAEVCAALASRPAAAAAEVCVIGNPALTDLYIKALSRRGIESRQMGEAAGARGLYLLAATLRRKGKGQE